MHYWLISYKDTRTQQRKLINTAGTPTKWTEPNCSFDFLLELLLFNNDFYKCIPVLPNILKTVIIDRNLKKQIWSERQVLVISQQNRQRLSTPEWILIFYDDCFLP